MKAPPPSRQKKPPHPQKLKFLCSFNGFFTTRNPNAAAASAGLRYVGGDTHLISVDRRHCLTLSNLFSILSNHHSSSSPFSLYYQTPEASHLLPISTDEDVRKMVGAHDWLLSRGNVSRLRLFLISCDFVNEMTHQRKMGTCRESFDWGENVVDVRGSISPNGVIHQRNLGNCCESFLHVRFNRRAVCINPNEMTHQRRGRVGVGCLKFGKIASCENKGIVQCRAKSHRMGIRGSRVSRFGSNELPEGVCSRLRPKSWRDKVEERSVACDNHCFRGSVVSMSIRRPHGSLVNCYVSRDDFVSRTNLVENRSPLGKGDVMEDRSRDLGLTILDVAQGIQDIYLNDKIDIVGPTNICSEEVAENGSKITHNTALGRELQIINDPDLEQIRELGSGAYGTVFYGKWKGSDVAIKRLKSSCFSDGALGEDKLVADFWKEAHLLAQLHHPNVAAFYGVVKDGPLTNMATVTEFMVNGSLKQVLRKKDRTIDRRKRLIIAMDVAFGMEYLHEKNIVHFDLKSHNLLVNMKDPCRPICKIGDLGLSKVKQRTLVSGGVRGTISWMAPELLTTKNNMVSEKVDVYSFGIVMWELLTGEEPYEDMRSEEIIVGTIEGYLRPDIPSWCDPSWRSLMERCWSSDPSSRSSFSEISKELRSVAASLNIK